MPVAGACVLTFCRRQACIALSSAEAELYAMTATLIEARGIQQFLGELKVTGTIEAEVDASAALAIASRLGPGRLKHVDIRQLWVQQEVAAGRVLMKKVATSLNCADILTKILKEVSVFRGIVQPWAFGSRRTMRVTRPRVMRQRIRPRQLAQALLVGSALCSEWWQLPVWHRHPDGLF